MSVPTRLRCNCHGTPSWYLRVVWVFHAVNFLLRPPLQRTITRGKLEATYCWNRVGSAYVSVFAREGVNPVFTLHPIRFPSLAFVCVLSVFCVDRGCCHRRPETRLERCLEHEWMYCSGQDKKRGAVTSSYQFWRVGRDNEAGL